MNRKTDRPNVLFIMSDQHRYDYLETAENAPAALNTPNLRRLAETGVSFPNCTVNAPVCAPSRIALASGLQPSRLGAVDNGSFLPATVPTYYQQLRDHGYRVGCVGKLDLAKPDGYNGRYGDRPRTYSWGFTHPEECEGKMHAGSSPTPIGPYTHYLEEKGMLKAFHEDYRKRSGGGWIKNGSHDSVLSTEDFADTYIGRRATEFIETIPDDFPWHMFVSFVGPHDPFDPPTEYGDKYRDAEMPPAIVDNMEGKPEWVKQRVVNVSPDEITVTRQQYCAATELIDDQIGEMLRALEQRGMLDNTYIIYSSDHGEMLGDHGLYTKSVAYEASLRVPLLVSGPGIPRNQISDSLVELIDLNPTICDLADVPVLPRIDARSIASVLRGETETHRSETVSALRNFRCIRTATHKLIENYNDVTELYDLENDPVELHNIAQSERKIAGTLKARLGRRFRSELVFKFTFMHTSHTYDAKGAYHHITQLAIPRLVGSAGEAETQDYIVEQFTGLGLDVSWEPFAFTKFPAEVLPRILSALFVLIVLSVPWFGERFPIPVCFACVLSLTIAMFFTQWQKRLEGLYDVGRRHRTENIVATNNANRDNNTPTFLFVAHYDSKSQVLPIAVRVVAYGITIVGLIVLTIVMLVKVIALIWLANYIVWGIAGVTSFCLLLLQINVTENRSPGGFDNASGVGVMLEVARVMMARDEKKSVTFLATGAEEYGMCGALRYIQAHADEYDRENTYVINLDGLGVGNGVNLITRYGIPPTRTTRTLSNLFRTSSEALGIRVSERYLPIGVGLDSIPIASRGFETVTLTARGVGGVALKIHSKQDRSELLNAESLQQVGELIVDVIECA